MVNPVLARFGGLLFAVGVAAVCGLPTTAVAQQNVNYSCEVAVQGPRSVRAAFEEYYECTEPLEKAWLKKYPKEVAQLERLYKAWKVGRGHDLRNETAAGAWVKKYPVRFAARDVALSAAQVEQGRAVVGGEPVQVSGAFERLFVERDNRRLFLTSAEEGLVSISIAARYAFTLEGKVGAGGARDFFVYDSKTAFVEEPNPAGGDRDLVVLDISDRAKPKEVARVKGAIPELSGQLFLGKEAKQGPPTFGEYLQIREGKMRTTCGQPPTVSTHPGIRCRPDGSCYKEVGKRYVEEGVSCTRAVPLPRFMGGSAVGSVVSSGAGGMSMRGTGTGGGGEGFGRVGGGRLVEQRGEVSGEASSQGGAGGAGSLSQMMIHGSTLYVLTGSERINHGWLTTFDVSKPRKPQLRHVIGLDNSPEALQKHDNLLLIAGRGGVVTASLGVPASPRLLGEFRQNCPANRDPIVVEGSLGYRTIIVAGGRRGTCVSRLEVIDLSHPHQPVLRTTVPIDSPRGLAVLGTRLFVADEREGIVLFDLADPVNPARVGTWKMPGVKDMVLSDFDLYAMSADEIQTFYVGELFQGGTDLAKAREEVVGTPTVVRKRAEESLSTVASP